MKKILKCLIIIFILLPVAYYAFAENKPFIGYFGDRSGGELDPLKFQIAFFTDNRYSSLCQDDNFYKNGAKGPYIERGSYSSSNDSIYITIKESNVPNYNERIGLTFGIKYIYSDDHFRLIQFTNVPVLTFGWATEDTMSFTWVVTSVKRSKWSDIKRKFMNP
jgi:hypothetical protein